MTRDLNFVGPTIFSCQIVIYEYYLFYGFFFVTPLAPRWAGSKHAQIMPQIVKKCLGRTHSVLNTHDASLYLVRSILTITIFSVKIFEATLYPLGGSKHAQGQNVRKKERKKISEESQFTQKASYKTIDFR